MQIQPLTWQSFLLQILLSLGPAAVALAATYITLRHQRKLKADELAISTTLRARELMFEVYDKRLNHLLEQSAAIGETLAQFQVVIAANDDEKAAEAMSRFMGVVYSQFFQAAVVIDEIEADLSALGLAGKYASDIRFIRSNMKNEFQKIPPPDPNAGIEILVTACSYLIGMQRAVVDIKAKELFQEYLPPASVKAAK